MGVGAFPCWLGASTAAATGRIFSHDDPEGDDDMSNRLVQLEVGGREKRGGLPQ